MKDIAIAMVTVDRAPGPNYLAVTLENLRRAGVFYSPRLMSPCGVVISDSRPGRFAAIEADKFLELSAQILLTDVSLTANVNVARALAAASESGAAWVLFLEDDIDVCAHFLDGVGEWLDEHAVPGPMVYAFGAAYDVINAMDTLGMTCWQYAIHDFYGTQAFALRAEDAASLAAWIVSNEFLLNDTGTAYDLLMHYWARERKIPHFMASVPSFVQHIGVTSLIAPRDNVHTFKSWRGREWQYRRKVAV